MRYNFTIVLLFICIFRSSSGGLNQPDFDSGWVLISSANSLSERDKALKVFKHGFDELPLLVDVQAKAIDGPNKGFIFPATGHAIRDDDRAYYFGNVVYIYDKTTIQVGAPIRNNGRLGCCIYTGFSPYWEGPGNQRSYSAHIRARAWKATSLPKPDYTLKGIKLTAASGRREDSYLSVSHGLLEHPSLVISRIRVPEEATSKWSNFSTESEFYADSVGSGSIIYTSYADNERNGYVIYGFDNSSIRVWAPSRPWGYLFSGGDGGSALFVKVTFAFLELYAWREESLTPSVTVKKHLRPDRISSTDLTMYFEKKNKENETFTRAWVQAVDGKNFGYRFVGSGAVGYDRYVVSRPCSYGGLVYAYTNSTMRFWKPGRATNGALVCLQDKLGEATNTQASNQGIAVVKVWQLGIATSVRIKGGWTKYSGIVEVYVNKTWNPVCLEGFTELDAMVVCNVSGHKYDNDSSVSVRSNIFYGINASSTGIANLMCNGSEDSLDDCSQGEWMNSSHFCDDRLAAVNCRSSTSIRIMSGDHVLPIGNTALTGRVEVLYNEKWGSICDDKFDDKDAHVLCSMMGFTFGQFTRGEYGPSAGQTIIDDLQCLGIEGDVSDCKAKHWGLHNCRNDESVVIHCDNVENIDPCKRPYYTRLPNLEFRYVSTKIDSVQQSHNDSKLPYRWYYVGENKMPQFKPELGRCGTNFPIYSIDAAPDKIGDIRTIRAKQVDSEIQYDIQVKKCDGFYVYRLPATTNDTSGYCFGMGSDAPGPEYLIGNAETVVMHNKTEVWFVCKFDESPEDLFYQVNWKIDGNSRLSIVKGYCNRSNMSKLHLTSDDFVENDIQLGIYIKCEVRPFFRPYGQPGPKSRNSSEFFAGLDIKTSKLHLRSGETSSVHVVNTVPLVCNQRTGENCQVSLKYTTPEHNTCASIPAFPQGCNKQFTPDSVGEDTAIEITTTETGQYSVPGKYTILMEAQPSFDNMKLWRYSNRLKEIEVNILPESTRSNWRGKMCSARNDPHMFTFDGRRYEHHEADGEYIMYRHTRFTNVEIQHKIVSCYQHSRVKCNCGVAVRAGRDVYVINVCNGSLDIGYKLCGDGVLTTMKENDFTYTIVLPYGTAVKVRIDNAPRRHRPGKLIDISVLPSLHDRNGSSAGLCGTLNGNKNDDFNKNGNSAVEFIRSWRVLMNESLFTSDFKFMKLDSWFSSVCICQRQSFRDVFCSRTLTGCYKGLMTGRHSCGDVSHRRSVRSVSDHRRIPIVTQTRAYWDHRIAKKFDEAEKKNWTIEEAKTYCTAYFGGNNIYNLCKQLPATQTNISLENCILDITQTNTVEWTEITRQAMQDTCNTELDRNTTVRAYLKENENTTTGDHDSRPQTTQSTVNNREDILIEQIRKESCLNNCSNHGSCEEGVCSCDDGYGASDCSIDMMLPPRVVGLFDDGLCDEVNTPCSYLYVFGEVFVGNEVICRLLEFQIDEDGKKTFKRQHMFLVGIADSLIEAVCDIREVKSKVDELDRAFIRGYHVSMSNDGNHYSTEQVELYIFDSTCQTYFRDKEELRFYLKEGFCFIKRKCIAHGYFDLSGTRYCDTGISNYSWTEKSTTTTTATISTLSSSATTASPFPETETSMYSRRKTEEEDAPMPLTHLNIGLISTTALAVMFAILITTAVCCYYRRRDRKRLEHDVLYNEDRTTRSDNKNGDKDTTFSNPAYNILQD